MLPFKEPSAIILKDFRHHTLHTAHHGCVAKVTINDPHEVPQTSQHGLPASFGGICWGEFGQKLRKKSFLLQNPTNSGDSPENNGILDDLVNFGRKSSRFREICITISRRCRQPRQPPATPGNPRTAHLLTKTWGVSWHSWPRSPEGKEFFGSCIDFDSLNNFHSRIFFCRFGEVLGKNSTSPICWGRFWFPTKNEAKLDLAEGLVKQSRYFPKPWLVNDCSWSKRANQKNIYPEKWNCFLCFHIVFFQPAFFFVTCHSCCFRNFTDPGSWVSSEVSEDLVLVALGPHKYDPPARQPQIWTVKKQHCWHCFIFRSVFRFSWSQVVLTLKQWPM